MGRIFLLLVVINAICMEGNTQSDTTRRPSVGEHIFTPVTYSNLPFRNTYLSTITGFGQSSELVNQLGLIGQGQGLTGAVTFLDLGFAYQQGVRDWLAAYININVSAKVGTEIQSILSQGITTITGFNVGWHIRLAEGNKFALSTIIELQNYRGSFINILGYIQDIQNNNPSPTLNENIPVLALASGLRYAYGLNETIGFKAYIDLGYGESYSRGENGYFFDAGGGIDLDFYPRYSFPVGLVVNYNITSMPELVSVKGERAQIILTKIAFTKATDFSLGIEYSYMKFPFTGLEDPATVQSIALAARYYF